MFKLKRKLWNWRKIITNSFKKVKLSFFTGFFAINFNYNWLVESVKKENDILIEKNKALIEELRNFKTSSPG